MPAKQTIFHSHSRKAFPEEAPVLDAAQRAAVEIAHKYGKADGAALFKGVVHVTANPTVHSAVELMRQGGVTLAKSRQDTYSDTVVTEVRSVGVPKPGRRSAIEDANNEAARLLRALGLLT
jgi:hypothetical protein